MSFLWQTVIFLGAAVVAVPLSKRLGLGSVLGYLAAGIAIGPWGLRLVGDVENVMHFAEFGVVLLLFVIGLELSPRRLWSLRKAVFGLGGAQVVVTGILLGLAASWAGLDPVPAAVVGVALSLSSTAFALQTLAERNQLATRPGRVAFSILLFQDLSVIPLLAIVPLLGAGAAGAEPVRVIDILVLLAVVVGIVAGGRFVLRYVLRLVAAAGIHEIFTAIALFTVIGAALVVEHVGLSMGLGAFLAGLLLADSEYRHELEADIEPFKGLLLGLFFIAVGMSVDIGLVTARPWLIAGLVLGLTAVKFAVLFGIGRIGGLDRAQARRLAVAISQGGEFAFVVFGVAAGAGLLDRGTVAPLVLAVTLSMALTPLLFAADEAWMRRQARGRKAAEYDVPASEESQVIIAGFGRFGQIVARILRAKRIAFTALEASPDQVDFVRLYGNKVYYGDASRLDLLRAAKADRAKVFVLAIDDVEASLRTAETVRRHFPNLTIYARARNRKHAYRLMDLGITRIQRETFLSSLEAARDVLRGLGLSDRESERAVRTFREHDEHRLFAHHAEHDDEQRMIALSKASAKELEELFAEDVEAETQAGRS